MNIEKLREIKKKMKISNIELANISGVPLGTLSKIMAGIISNPKISTISAIAQALNCTLDDLEENKEKANFQIIKNIKLSDKEEQLIIKYREQPQMQEAVDKILGIEETTTHFSKQEKYTKKKIIKNTANNDDLVIDDTILGTEYNLVANVGISEPPKVKRKSNHT